MMRNAHRLQVASHLETSDFFPVISAGTKTHTIFFFFIRLLYLKIGVCQVKIYTNVEICKINIHERAKRDGYNGFKR
jgi:hypothetical protein